MSFGKKLRRAFHKWTPAGQFRHGVNHVRHKIGLTKKHTFGKLLGTSGISSYDTSAGFKPKTLSQLTTH